MKILFLDIDGVLNSTSWAMLNNRNPGTPRSPWNLDPRCVRLLRFIVEQTDCYIVVSSTWRRQNPAHMQHWFAYFDWHEAPIIGSTDLPKNRDDYNTSRGTRIKRWLERTQYDIETYAILDDNNDGFQDMPFVQTSFIEGGLTYSHALQTRNILNETF